MKDDQRTPTGRRTASAVQHWPETETCPHCLQPYSYETQILCVTCNQPVCPFCVTIQTVGTRLCPDCHDGCGEEQEGD
ncbi:hypothetical protein [Desulfonatronum lacustre]|uniref:hypothetical protein n=1 Tax=Desulfonatronum lacustre TaxID=66849 RepID=UPI00054F4A35|nr:hypothetical protein [Desulfonatronum lacustre]